MMRYIFIFVCTLFSLFNVCEAKYVQLERIGYLQYGLDIEHYEKINDIDYYMYIASKDVNTHDVCVLHIMTNKEEHSYIVTDSVVYIKGIKCSYKEYETGTYNDDSIISKAIKILDNMEKEIEV